MVGRLAPTPSAGLHVGNIFSCLVAWLYARKAHGSVILRIEDVDRARCRTEYVDSILQDLQTLGLTWDNDVILFQAARTSAYDAAFEQLEATGLVYPCFCSRADLHAASAPHAGEHFVYAGTCRHYCESQRREMWEKRRPAMRLAVPDKRFTVDDMLQGPYRQNLARECGDYIIRRSDGIYSYQLAVVVDDLAQGVNQVVRGFDLLECAPQQEYLRSLLQPGVAPIEYAHVPLLLDENGRRLAKRDRDMGLAGIMEHFRRVEDFLGYLAHLTGLAPTSQAISAQELIQAADIDALKGKRQITWRLP